MNGPVSSSGGRSCWRPGRRSSYSVCRTPSREAICRVYREGREGMQNTGQVCGAAFLAVPSLCPPGHPGRRVSGFPSRIATTSSPGCVLAKPLSCPKLAEVRRCEIRYAAKAPISRAWRVSMLPTDRAFRTEVHGSRSRRRGPSRGRGDRPREMPMLGGLSAFVTSSHWALLPALGPSAASKLPASRCRITRTVTNRTQSREAGRQACEAFLTAGCVRSICHGHRHTCIGDHPAHHAGPAR